MTVTLNGATNTPPENVMLNSAGEFAARWNTLQPEEREALWKAMQGACEDGYQCFMQDHAGLKQELERRTQVTDTQVNYLAQYFYEESGGRHGFTLSIQMANKQGLVAALTKALQRASVEVIPEEIEREVV